MNFKQLEAFYWLTKLNSFQRVAEHIGLTQPAVSARVAGLEDSLGVPLIDRSATEFTLTEQGHEVAEYAETFLNLSEAMAARIKVGSRRRFSIGTVGMVTRTWAISLRDKIAQRRPEDIIDFHSGANIDLRQKVRSGALDMAFVTGEAGLPQIGNGFAVEYSVGWIARPDLVPGLPADGTALSMEDLRYLPLIMYPRTSPLFEPVAYMVEETRRRHDTRHTGNSLGSIRDMVLDGFGAAAVPLASVERDLAAGRLVEIPTVVRLAPLDVRCVHVNKARKAQTAEIFGMAREAAEEWCAAHPRYAVFKAL